MVHIRSTSAFTARRTNSFGIGPVKANKILANCETEEELWKAVVATYEERGQTEEEAIWTMRLANMHQYDGTKIVLWKPHFQ